MEIRTIEFEGTLVLIRNNQKIRITPFLTPEAGNIKLGIDAPSGVSVNREEIYKKKKARCELEESCNSSMDYPQKVQALFSELVLITHKSEKLEQAAKELFERVKIITAKTLACIATGEKSTTAWIVTCAIDVLIREKPQSIKLLLSSDELHRLWSKPLLKQGIDKTILLKTAEHLNNPSLLEQINQLH
jgi:sRNA-binding carbon storage regulator CsrA